MVEFAQRSHAALSAAAHMPATPGGGPLNDAPRVRQLAERAVTLNAGRAPIQLNGGGKKKQEKKKAKAKKVDKIVRSVGGYDTSQASRQQIVEAIGRGKLSKMRAGHLSADSSQKMNSGTRKTITGLTGSIKDEKAKARQQAKESRRADSDVEEEDLEDFDADDGEDYSPPRGGNQDRDPPPPGGSAIQV